MADSSTSSTTYTKTTVILSSPSDWDEWFLGTKSTAQDGQVWDYVNPDTTKDAISKLTEPRAPTVKDIKIRS